MKGVMAVDNFEDMLKCNQNTVIDNFIPEIKKEKMYQSEDALEQDFMKRLKSQGYEYLSINSEENLIENLRDKLQQLNEFVFSNNEWTEFYHNVISNGNDDIQKKTSKIQENHVHCINLDTGRTKNIVLIDKNNILNNKLQVINQYTEEEGSRKTRYDVTILVNGLPLIHIELKRRGVAIREAFNQINRYQRDSFWAGSGLYEYVQLFIISNGTHTKYYSNTTRDQLIKDNDEKITRKKRKTSNSFEFTSFWADANNKVISDLADFTNSFLEKYTILSILTKYCIFTSEQILLVMRPYQIAATEKIINKIEIAKSKNLMGTRLSGGYVWHTTGSGKTLTSYKTAQLASQIPDIKKVLFIVDRKDLDYQTMKEYDRFEKGAANSNTSTKILKKQLEDGNISVIISTIQKLGNFVSKNKTHDIYSENVVMIFDECHRSQFGEMHKSITTSFEKYYLFGFTGTPIFASNSSSGNYVNLKTTAQAFGGELDDNGNESLALHTYTIVDAIHDNNVLPFKIDYINTIKNAEIFNDKKVSTIDKEKALLDPIRIQQITEYILDHFDQKTYRNQNHSYYAHSITVNIDDMLSSKSKRLTEQKQIIKVNGFNSIFAVSSIPAAIVYYKEFKKQIFTREIDFKIATIFSFNQNEEDPDDILHDETFDPDDLNETSRDFLDSAITDYNKSFNVNYDTSSDSFQNYYKDISLRMKNREIDLLIVVNMFLTGFDATTLNTLWVDKNLKQHGLIQAFSRTNRILNSVKTFGNIVCFRNLEENTNTALTLFGNKETSSVVLLKTYDEYMFGYDHNGKHFIGYKELVEKLQGDFPLDKDIIGETAEKSFVSMFGKILKMRNILSSFDEYDNTENFGARDFQDYQSTYIDLYQNYSKKSDSQKERINDDIVFEIELVKQVEINIDYILLLVEKYSSSKCKDKTVVLDIDKSIDSSMELRSKKELIKSFINQMSVDCKVDEDWRKFVEKKKSSDLGRIIDEEMLVSVETNRLMDNAFEKGYLRLSGAEVDKIIPPMSRFSKRDNRHEKKEVVTEKLSKFFEQYFGI